MRQSAFRINLVGRWRLIRKYLAKLPPHILHVGDRLTILLHKVQPREISQIWKPWLCLVFDNNYLRILKVHVVGNIKVVVLPRSPEGSPNHIRICLDDNGFVRESKLTIPGRWIHHLESL